MPGSHHQTAVILNVVKDLRLFFVFWAAQPKPALSQAERDLRLGRRIIP